jgi:hypothetical protein
MMILFMEVKEKKPAHNLCLLPGARLPACRQAGISADKNVSLTYDTDFDTDVTT